MNGVRSTRPLATEGADAGLGAVLSCLQVDFKAALLPLIYPVSKSQSAQ